MQLTANTGPTASKIRVTEFVARRANSLRGFGTLEQQSGQNIHDVAFHIRDGRAWAQPPAKPRLNRDGQHMKDADGKGLWTPIISFASKEVRDRWSAAAVEALLASFPHALDGAS